MMATAVGGHGNGTVLPRGSASVMSGRRCAGNRQGRMGGHRDAEPGLSVDRRLGRMSCSLLHKSGGGKQVTGDVCGERRGCCRDSLEMEGDHGREGRPWSQRANPG